jgi:hypothetical protein
MLKLSQIQKEPARQLEICGFETFREAVVHENGDGRRFAEQALESGRSTTTLSGQPTR